MSDETTGERIVREAKAGVEYGSRVRLAAAIDAAIDVPAKNYAVVKQAHDEMRFKRDEQRQRAEQAERERDEEAATVKALCDQKRELNARLARLEEAARVALGTRIDFNPDAGPIQDGAVVSRIAMDALRAALEPEGEPASPQPPDDGKTRPADISAHQPSPTLKVEPADDEARARGDG